MSETVRFTRTVALPGGPVYHAGETAEADRFALNPRAVEELLRHGAAVRVLPKAVPAPPRDTAIKAAWSKKS